MTNLLLETIFGFFLNVVDKPTVENGYCPTGGVDHYKIIDDWVSQSRQLYWTTNINDGETSLFDNFLRNKESFDNKFNMYIH